MVSTPLAVWRGVGGEADIYGQETRRKENTCGYHAG